MQSTWRRRLLLSGSLALLALFTVRAQANGLFTRDYVVTPTVYAETLPTSYVVPTSYVFPTSYVSTSYVLPTSYVVPTVATSVGVPAYVATSYVWGGVVPAYYTQSYIATSRRLFRRNIYTSTSYVVPTSYVYAPSAYYPTAYYYPTVYDYVPTVLTTASTACDPDPCCVTRAPAAVASRSTGGLSNGSGSGMVRGNEATNGGSIPSTVESVPAGRQPNAGATDAAKTRSSAPMPPAGAGSGAGTVEPNVPTPPTAPAADKDAATTSGATPVTPPPPKPNAPGGQGASPSGAAKPPVAPGDEPVQIPLPNEAETVRRDSLKPVGATRPPVTRTARRGALNVLEGKVLSADTRTPEEGVRITLSNRLGTFADRVIQSDAYGRYAVRLPDGDWTVNVTMPSGRSYAVSQLIISNGQIVDDQGRDVPSLVISR
jgi:hypothetical protein